MRADRRNPLIAQLRRYKPTKFELTLQDGTKKTVPLSAKQNRWEQLDELLEALKWTVIEAQDAEGNTLGAVERDGEVIEDIDPDIQRAEAFSRILLSAVTSTMSEVRKMFADTMKANAEMSRAMLESQHVVVESYQLALKVQSNVMLQAGAGEGDDKFSEMMKMAMMMYAGGKPAITVTPPPSPAKPRIVPTNGKAPTP